MGLGLALPTVTHVGVLSGGRASRRAALGRASRARLGRRLYNSRQNAAWKSVASGVLPISRRNAKTSEIFWNTRSISHRFR